MTVVAIGLATAACAGAEPATSAARSDTAAAAAATVASLPSADFAAALADDDILVLNVHVPDEGSIAGTNIAIPYDDVRDRCVELP